MCSKHNIRIIGPGLNNPEFAAIGNVLAMEGTEVCYVNMFLRTGF